MLLIAAIRAMREKGVRLCSEQNSNVDEVSVLREVAPADLEAYRVQEAARANSASVETIEGREMRKELHWSVTVERDGEPILTIGHNHLSGRNLSPEDEDAIDRAASSLRGFIGDTRNSFGLLRPRSFVMPDDEGMEPRGCLSCASTPCMCPPGATEP